MLKISRLTDYAVMVLNGLGDEAEPQSAAILAGKTGLPEPTVSKVLKMLAQNDILVSARGPRGGYILKRPMGDLSLADIIGAIDGPIALTDCSEGSESRCSLESICDMRRRWAPVNAVIVTALRNISLADMRR